MAQGMLDPSKYRRTFLKDLEVDVHIGWNEDEKQDTQRVVINMEIYAPLEFNTPHKDDLSEVIDVHFLRDTALDIISKGHIQLQETLCDEVARRLLAHPLVHATKVSTQKSEAFSDCIPGVEVFLIAEEEKTQGRNNASTPTSTSTTTTSNSYAAVAQGMSDPSKYRRTFLKDLEVDLHIGWNEDEKQDTQRVVINMEIYAPLEFNTPHKDDLSEVIDVHFLRDTALDIISKGHIQLQETLCDEVARRLLAHPLVHATKVSTQKSEAFSDCIPGVEVFLIAEEEKTQGRNNASTPTSTSTSTSTSAAVVSNTVSAKDTIDTKDTKDTVYGTPVPSVPSVSSGTSGKAYSKAYIALGSNVANRAKAINEALKKILRFEATTLNSTSFLYEVHR